MLELQANFISTSAVAAHFILVKFCRPPHTFGFFSHLAFVCEME